MEQYRKNRGGDVFFTSDIDLNLDDAEFQETAAARLLTLHPGAAGAGWEAAGSCLFRLEPEVFRCPTPYPLPKS
jgi:hypothetical protein